MPSPEFLIKLLLVEYLLIAVAAACQQKWPFVLYYVSAAAISVAVLWMGVAK